MTLRLNGSTSGYIEIDAPAVAGNQTFIVPNDFGFPSGTTMLFVQTSAPTGWTKSTTHNDKALRVVSGAASSGGATAFSAVMNGSVNATTLTEAQIPSHTHSYSSGLTTQMNASSGTIRNVSDPPTANTSGATGGGGSHTHSMNVAYVDVIIATKD
jgi:hypothetical protein